MYLTEFLILTFGYMEFVYSSNATGRTETKPAKAYSHSVSLL